MRVRRVDYNDCRISKKPELVRPPEVLCRILQLAVGPDGVQALLPFTRINSQWRRAALGDSSLWTTIHLKQTTTPLLDTILAHAGNRLLTVHADHPDLNRFEQLWKLADRIEELHYSTGLGQLTPFLSSLGPAPNLKVLDLRPPLTMEIEEPIPFIDLPAIFSGCLPLLRDLTITNTFTWPTGLFRGLISLDCGAFEHHPISPDHVLDALRESPSIESIRLVGHCTFPQGFNPPTVPLLSLRKCTLVGHGTTFLVRRMTIPASAIVFLSRQFVHEAIGVPMFDDLSKAPGLQGIDEISAISLSINDDAFHLEAKNDHGGVLDAEVYGIYDLSQDPVLFIFFLRSFFELWFRCPGLRTTREFTLDIERGRVWGHEEVMYSAHTVTAIFLHLFSVEEVKFRGVPPRELSIILGFLFGSSRPKIFWPNLKRLYIESIPLSSPKSLLVALDKLLTEGKERRVGVSFQSITVKVKCEMLIPATDHCAFLTSWDGLVGGGIRLEYEQTEVKKLRRCRRRNREDEKLDREEEDKMAGTDDPDCVGWDGWPEKWPKVIGEMGKT
jgi:hypothetical protein